MDLEIQIFMLKTDKAEEGQNNPGPLKFNLDTEKILTVAQLATEILNISRAMSIAGPQEFFSGRLNC